MTSGGTEFRRSPQPTSFKRKRPRRAPG
ncbi:MAG: hypothetical protein QOF00_351, partial [Pseudonocardiales bacterium]|nr:hypothetical protein [Pseudonocardiales bacterium]